AHQSPLRSFPTRRSSDLLEPVVDAEQALEDKSLLHDEAGTNRVWNGIFEYGDVEKAFKDAAYVVHIDRLHFHRFSSTPLENNVVDRKSTRLNSSHVAISY